MYVYIFIHVYMYIYIYTYMFIMLPNMFTMLPNNDGIRYTRSSFGSQFWSDRVWGTQDDQRLDLLPVIEIELVFWIMIIQ